MHSLYIMQFNSPAAVGVLPEIFAIVEENVAPKLQFKERHKGSSSIDTRQVQI